MFRSAVALLLFFSFNSWAEESQPLGSITADERRAIEAAEVMGATIHRHDRAAWIATDSLSRIRGFKQDRRVRGWVTEEVENLVRVTVFGEEGDGHVALYRADVRDNGKVKGRPTKLKVPEPLSRFESEAARARAAALQAEFAPCSSTYNTVILPNKQSQGSWFVYILPGTTKRHIVPIGGTYRADVDAMGVVVNLRSYTHTCIVLENPQRAVVLGITHLLDPTPTDVHVFWSIWAKKPLLVGTTSSNSAWSVEGPEIQLIKRYEPNG